MPAISVSRESDTRVKADVTVNADEIKPAEAQALKKVAAQVEIKGFRKGKAPAHLIKQKYASDIRYETIYSLIDNHIADVEDKIDERIYRVVRIEDVQDKGEKLSFVVKLDLFPYVKIGKLKSAQLTRHIAAIDDADVDADIRERLLRFATYEEQASADAAAEKNDKLTVDFEIWIDDAPSGEVNKDYQFDLGSGTLSRELETQIAEKHGKVGEEFKLKKSIPAQEDGKERSYEIIATITKIAKPKLPELSDAFVAEHFKGSNNVAEFKMRVKEDIERRFEIVQTRVEVDQALKALEAVSEFHISESFLDQQIADFLAERKIVRDELSAEQVTNLKKSLADREKSGILMQQLIRDAEKFHQKKNKSDEAYMQNFKRYVRAEITRYEEPGERTAKLLEELDKAIDAMSAGESNRSPWESLVGSYLTAFNRNYLLEYFDEEGIVKKGKKLSYKELAATLPAKNLNPEE